MTGEAFTMRLQLARLMQRHQVAPEPHHPIAPLAPVDHDVIVEGYCAPAVVDRERTKFAPHCWMPFQREIPLLYRHQGQPVGEVQEVRCDDRGLYVRALVTDPAAKLCPFFSVAATIHGYSIQHADDREQFHGLITCASLDHIAMTPTPANPHAIVLHRYRQSPAVQFYDIAKAGFNKVAEIIQVLTAINAEHQRASRPQSSATPARVAPRVDRTPRPAVHRPKTEFRKLVEQLNEHC